MPENGLKQLTRNSFQFLFNSFKLHLLTSLLLRMSQPLGDADSLSPLLSAALRLGGSCHTALSATRLFPAKLRASLSTLQLARVPLQG